MQLTSVALLSDVVVIFLNPIVALTPNGNVCVVPVLNSVNDVICLILKIMLQNDVLSITVT